MSRVTPYVKTTWADRPSTSSSIDSTNLNHIEQGIKNVTDAVNEMVVEVEPATESKLGGVKVGSGLSIEQDGTLSATGGGGASELNDLDDVEVSNPSSGQVLKYNATTSKFENSDEGESYTLPPATQNTLGGIKVGSRLSIEQDGTLSADTQQYTLPPATQNTLGGIKVGSRLSIEQDGTLSADAQQYTLPPATQNTLGGIKVGENLSIEQDGTLSAAGSSVEGMSYEETITILDNPIYKKVKLFPIAKNISAYGPWNPSPQPLTISEDGLITFSPTGIADVPGINLATVIDLDGFTIPIGSKLVFSGKGGEDLYFNYQNQKVELVDGKTTIAMNCTSGRLTLYINVINGKAYDISCVPEVWIPQT